jgi:hypothetical protein
VSERPAAQRRTDDASRAALVRAETPEDRELTRKLLELGQLEEVLADRELTFASLSAEVRSFELRYGRVVGVRLAELDQVEAEIAEEWARRHPNDNQAAENARRTRERFESSSRSASAATAAPYPKQADGNLRALYREVARQLHPDLAADDESRYLRTKLMADANRAYEAADEDVLRTLLRDWAGRPESVMGDSVASQLIRTIRKIDQVRSRLKRLDQETERLRNSDPYQLMERVKDAEKQGQDLLAEITDRVTREIANARTRQRRMRAA